MYCVMIDITNDTHHFMLNTLRPRYTAGRIPKHEKLVSLFRPNSVSGHCKNWPDIGFGRTSSLAEYRVWSELEFGWISEPKKWPDIGIDSISGGQISGSK